MDPIPGPTPVHSTGAGAADTGKRFTPVIAPIPFYNPMLEYGVVVAALALGRIGNDTATPPSTSGLMGLATTNGTWGVGAIHFGNYAGDRWRSQLVGGYFDFVYDYFGTGQDQGDDPMHVTLEQPVWIARAIILKRVLPGLFLGGGYTIADAQVKLKEIPDSLPPFITTALEEGIRYTVASLGPTLGVDTRDDQYFPTAGVFVNASTDFYDPAFGSDSTFQNTMIFASWYTGWDGGAQVIAAGAQGCLSTGEVPISSLCMIGGPNGLRGVETGRYRDRSQLAFQGEYRRMFGRFGATAFLGVAQVAPAIDEYAWGEWFVAGGAGVRFKLSQKFPLNYRVDLSTGPDGFQYYISLGENF